MKKSSKNFGTVYRGVLAVLLCVAGLILAFTATRKVVAQNQSPGTPQVQGIYRGLSPVVKFDVSPPMRQMAVVAPGPGKLREDEDRDLVPFNVHFAPEWDPVVQTSVRKKADGAEIPDPIVTFNAQTNTSGVVP